MKAGIHPDYRTGLFHDTAAVVFFLIGSTADSDRTHKHSDGNTYPYIPLDVSSASHPIYTGQQRKTQVECRIAGSNKRFASFGSSPKKADARGLQVSPRRPLQKPERLFCFGADRLPLHPTA